MAEAKTNEQRPKIKTPMLPKEPILGTTGTADLVVGPQDLASSLSTDHGDEFPAVFATARMIALMEIAGSRVLEPFLGPGELSVGVTVDVSHTAPTPPGALVIATARYTGREGKLFVFEVTASDPGGEIGKGIHKRAIVASDRLVRAAVKRVGEPGD
jgi:fluoroacetyl-CoA thioesterase